MVGMKYSESGTQSGILFTERRKFALDEQVVKELFPDVGRFTTFITKLNSRPTSDSDYKMFEHRSLWYDMKFYVNNVSPAGWSGSGPWTLANLDVDDGATADPGYLIDGLIVEIRDAVTDVINARAIVSGADPANKQVDLQTINKTGAPNALGDNDILYVIGNAHEEGSGAPEAWADELVIVWNSAQIMKTPVEITGTLYETALRGYSNELARLRKEKAMEHKMLKNQYFLKGIRNGDLGAPNHISGVNSRPIRTTEGIIPALQNLGTSDNKFAESYATFSYDDFVDMTEKLYQYVNERGVKYGFGGPAVTSFFSKTGAGVGFLGNNSAVNLQVANGTSRFGYPIKVIEANHGDLVLTKDIALRQSTYTNTLVIIDPKYIGHRIFRSPKYETAIQAPDIDGIKDQYFSDEGLDIRLIENHGLVEFS